MSFTAKAVLGVTAAAALCLSAAGCAGQGARTGTTARQPDPLAGMTAKQIATKAISDLKSAPGFTMSGTISESGKATTVSIGVKGNGCAMTIGMGSKGSMTMIAIGKSMWMKGDAAFWKSTAGSSSFPNSLVGKYVKLPPEAGSQFSSSAGMCDVNQMTSSSSKVPLSENVVKGPVTTVNGQRVYTLTDKSEDVTMYATDTCAPRIIEVVSTKKGDSGRLPSPTVSRSRSRLRPPARR